MFLTAIEYWIERLKNNLPLLQRFTRQFVLEGLFFYISKLFFHQIKGTGMGTKCIVAGSNLVVAYKEIKLFELLPQIYPQDFIGFLLPNYNTKLQTTTNYYDIFHKFR